MDPLTCPLGTPWCTDHEPPDAPDNWAECARIIGTPRTGRGVSDEEPYTTHPGPPYPGWSGCAVSVIAGWSRRTLAYGLGLLVHQASPHVRQSRCYVMEG